MPLKLEVVEYEPARGANDLYSSPDGRVLAAQFNFVGGELPPLIKVIERPSGKLLASVRGTIAAAPDKSGEVAYVAHDSKGQPVLRSTVRLDVSVPLPGVAATTDYFFYGGHRVGQSPDLVVVFWYVARLVHLAVFNLGTKAIAVERTLAPNQAELMSTAANPRDNLVYVALPDQIVAVEGHTLQERWRISLPTGLLWERNSPLAVTGDGALVVAAARNELFTMDAHDGKTQTVYRFPGLRVFELAGVPGRRAVVGLRILVQKGEGEEHSIEGLEFPCKQVVVLRPQTAKDHPAPKAIAVVGDQVLVAPASPPRWANDPTSWGADVRDLVQ